MKIKILKPKKAINKAFLKIKPNRTEIECFKNNLIQLLDRTNDIESEEFHKNLVIDFLKKTYYDPLHFINTKGRNDLVIHNGDKAASSVGVIIEAKKPTNKTEMITREKLNMKAFQELVLYYLRERITHKNLEIKYLIATNINEWFIFDSAIFEKYFAQNKGFVKQFLDFENARLAGKSTEFYYKEIAEPFIGSMENEIEFTHFDIREYENPLRNNNPKDDTKLIALFKLLSSAHLLKLPFANDSNSLDKRFYGELLHIIGLTETKQGGKKLIERNKTGERNTGSFLENAIIQLDSLDKIGQLEKPSQFGATQEERLFNVGLELSITWINRILFLKLLEAQLITYQKGDKSYEFLSLDKIKNYDDLNSLFFQVLARKYADRNADVKTLFEKVPYLNSSLFEPTQIEHATLFISNLRDDKMMSIYTATVLKNEKGKKRTGELNTLEYLFEFLNAYDFSSEGAEEIQEDNKTLINASVLGLIFEKINGYKDGSFFTPGFITMYMCRETIRKAIVQKFNETKAWNCEDLDSVYDKIENRTEANEIINKLKICDPAVGSGHFLVSALNEIISVKNDLKILQDRDGKRLKEYQVEVVNDELIVTDEDGELFEYNPGNKESQRIQEALFHEKQTIIENCLFGVDINPNSVKICRLRLWIELLKNAYYKSEKELETLPNIDINIKCGNSLISRFAIDADMSQALKKSKWSIDSYRMAVDTYRNAQNKEQKREMERLIELIKSDFRTEIGNNDPKIKRKAKLGGELYNLTMQQGLFEEARKEKKLRLIKVDKIEKELNRLTSEIEEIKNNKIYEGAFEWRFEFPEVLDANGDFKGFDVVIGNPPYIRQEDFKDLKQNLKNTFKVYNSISDLLTYFVELGYNILKSKGIFQFIISNKFASTNYGTGLRTFLIEKTQLTNYTDFTGVSVFDEATVDAAILGYIKNIKPHNTFTYASIEKNKFKPDSFEFYLNSTKILYDQNALTSSSWSFKSPAVLKIKSKIEKRGSSLKDWDINIYYGIKTGYNEAFVLDSKKRAQLILEDPDCSPFIKPLLRGRDINKYSSNYNQLWLIYIPKGFTIQSKKGEDAKTEEPIPRYGYYEVDEAWEWFRNRLPSIARHLSPFKSKADRRTDMGDYWWELRACAYLEEFEKPKIIYKDIAQKLTFLIDPNQFYTNNTNYFITGSVNLEYLAGLLNSSLIDFYYRLISTQLGKTAVRLFTQFVELIPIPPYENSNTCLKIVENVNQLITIKSRNPKADTSSLEVEIDQLVYQLYDLTEEEIAIVENRVL